MKESKPALKRQTRRATAAPPSSQQGDFKTAELAGLSWSRGIHQYRNTTAMAVAVAAVNELLDFWCTALLKSKRDTHATARWRCCTSAGLAAAPAEEVA